MSNLPVTTAAYEDVTAVLAAADMSRAVVLVQIGAYGQMTRRDLRMAVNVWRKVRRRPTPIALLLHIDGYDADPRELWQIPEVCSYAARWAKAADVDAAWERLHPTSRVFIEQCRLHARPKR